MPDPPEDAEAAKGKEGSEGSERGGASLKQQRLIENGWEESRFTANLITICSRVLSGEDFMSPISNIFSHLEKR